MSHKKDRMKTSKLSSSVLEYYYKYGQNRDLEKYLRMKRSTSKSSSDSSLKHYESSNYTSDSRRIAKSMDKLDISDSKSKSKDDSDQRAAKSTEDVCESGDGPKDQKKPNDKNQIKIEKKAQQQFKGKSKSKSYNLNLESSIEINLPSSTSLPILPTTQIIESIPKSTRMPQLESSETQTDPILSNRPIQQSISVQATLPTVPKTTAKTDHEQMKQTQDSMQETSPASSVASAKVRLEWDSMADIGYNRIIDFKSQSNSNLTTFEKSALTKFFAKRGLNFDDNFLILAPADNKSPLQKREFTQSAIEMREAQRIRKELPTLSPSTSKKMWEKALVKYREKYRKSKSQATSGIDTTHFMSISTAPHHSTPLPIITSNTNRYDSDECSNQLIQNPTESIAEKPKVELIEKWCQTSSIDVEAIGIQVDQPQISHMSKSVQIEIEQVHESTQKDDEDLTTATSFEFLAPSVYKNRRMTEKNTQTLNEFVDEIPNRKEIRNESIYIQDENPDDKENIPPIDDKENIPPPSDYKTPEQTINNNNNNNNESSVLPNDLQKGVDLINALIDSRTTDSATKKKLIRKIVRYLLKSKDTKDITQMIMSYSEKSSTKISGVSSLDLEESEQSGGERVAKDTISGISALSSSSSVTSASAQNRTPVNSEQYEKIDKRIREQKKVKEVEREKVVQMLKEVTKEDEKEKKIERQVDFSEDREVKDWLLPVTQSEIEKENARKSQIIQQIETIEEEQPKNIPSGRSASNEPKNSEKPLKNNEILEFLANEKRTHYNWIDQEIKHLKNLKSLLQNLNAIDSDESKGNVSEEKINSVYAKHNRNYLSIYENFQRHAKHTSGNGSQVDISSTLIDSSKSSNDSSRFPNNVKMGSKSHWIHRTTFESPPSTISSGSKVKPNSRESPRHAAKSNEANKLPEWDSHLNMQQLVKNRTKLKTPNSDESVEAYAKACRAKFDRKCSETKSDHGKKFFSKSRSRNQPIYTKPYSSDSYSDIQNIQRSNEDHMKGKQSDVSSVTESNGFLSPNSISIGVAANSTSNTTTHQYDTKISVGLQTTNTLKRMPIIQLKKSADQSKTREPEEQEQTTVRVNKLTINKQIQVRPEALAYIIMFKEDEDPIGNSKESMERERCNQLYANTKKINSICSGDSSSDSDASNGKSKRSVAKEQTTQFRGQTSSNSSSMASVDKLTLQECLQTRRPDFYASAEQRRKCLNDLHNLRQQRNEQRKKLFAMNVCTNAKTLNTNMKRLLPPPPLAQIRIFKSREIVCRTRRKYQKLPEILRREQLERDSKIRRNHRILVNMFSKNLQKHVLSGKTDLSNSMMIN